MSDARERAPEVLVVEGSTEIRRALEDGLAMQGYGVQAVASAEEALDAVRARPWDVIVVDLETGGADGVDLLARVRDADSGLPAVVVGRERLDPVLFSMTEASGAPPRSVLVRPFTLGRLLAAVRDQLADYPRSDPLPTPDGDGRASR